MAFSGKGKFSSACPHDKYRRHKTWVSHWLMIFVYWSLNHAKWCLNTQVLRSRTVHTVSMLEYQSGGLKSSIPFPSPKISWGWNSVIRSVPYSSMKLFTRRSWLSSYSSIPIPQKIHLRWTQLLSTEIVTSHHWYSGRKISLNKDFWCFRGYLIPQILIPSLCNLKSLMNLHVNFAVSPFEPWPVYT